MIPFNMSAKFDDMLKYIKDVIESDNTAGNGNFTSKCCLWFEKKFDVNKVLLTTSCTAALEMSAMLIGIKAGDEVIAPSYTFSTTVSSFVRCGAKIIFVDIRPDTMNINERLIEEAITPKTKAIIPVHYAGVACEMEEIMKIAHKYNLAVVEDAAQGVMASYKGKPLGTIGDIGCYSFHSTKNYSMGEGGAILINNKELIDKAEIIHDCGTDKAKFFRGQVNQYSWIECGSSFLPSDINAAYLFAQLERADEINNNRLNSFKLYYNSLKPLEFPGVFDIPFVPKECKHNAHMFYIKLRDAKERSQLIDYLKENGVKSVFHYIPLHSSKAGKQYGKFNGQDVYTTKESERLLRLPMYFGLDEEKIMYVVEKIYEFKNKNH